MKTRHIIRLLTLSAVLLGGFASCVKTSSEEIGNKRPITIGLGNQTRGIAIENASQLNGQKFGIVAFYPDGSTAAEKEHLDTYGKVRQSGATYVADLYNTSNVVTTYYWPLKGVTSHKLNFITWYPYEGTGIPTGVAKDVPNNKISMNFTVQNDIAQQVDLMAATHTPAWKGDVNLEFHHALTRIRFSFNKESSTETYTVSSVTLKNVVKVASLTVAGSGANGGTPVFTWVAGSTPAPPDLTWTPSTPLPITALSSTGTYNSMGDNETFMTIPMGDASAVGVVITVNGVAKPVTINDFETIGKTWTAGKYIDYKVTITKAGPLEIKASVLDWDKTPVQNVIFDGQYYLKVDKDELVIPAGETTVDFIAETDYHSLNLPQGYDEGIKIDLKGCEGWLNYSYTVNKDTDDWVYDFKLTAKNSVSNTGEIEIQAGNMIKTLKVTRE